MPPQVEIDPFDPSVIGDNRVCVLIGRRGSGKSSAMKTLLWYKRHIPTGIVMSETEDSNHFFEKYVPKTFIYDEYDSETLETLINVQRKRHKIAWKTDPDSIEPVFWIAEDCMGSEELARCKHAKRVFTNGRQWRIFALLSLQYVKDLPPKFRGQVDYVFAFRALADEEREKLYAMFFSGPFKSYTDFLQVFELCTSDYHCLVLDATKPTNKLEELVYWWKAPPVPEFKAGSKEFWEFHLMNYKEDEDEEPEVLVNKRHRRLKVKLKAR